MNQTLQLKYSCTNEDLRGVVSGLNLSSEDNVLAVAGSGDQAFAFLEFARQVKAVDIVPEQIEFMRKKAETLRVGNYDKFLNDEIPSSSDGHLAGTSSQQFAEFNQPRRREYFLANKGRLNKIRKNLGNLVIAEPADILEVAQTEQEFSKIYLSNVLTYGTEDRNAITEILRNIARNISLGGLIYVASHDGLSERKILLTSKKDESDFINPLENLIFNQISNSGVNKMYKVDRYSELYQDPDLRDESFLPPKLKVDRQLSLKVRGHEQGIWKPAVYKKI
ncbi:DUF3419 family protein [Candidatus Pacearchaeota archaeon]|nr:DUF3419 family protein [Candidatus Pacearchaeota archaeon]